MTNPLLGEETVSLPDGSSYTIAFGIGCLIAIKNTMGLDEAGLGAAINGGMDPELIAPLFCATLQDRHRGLTVEEATEIMNVYGVLPTTAKIVKAFLNAFAVDPDTRKPLTQPGAPAARVGTGAAS